MRYSLFHQFENLIEIYSKSKIWIWGASVKGQLIFDWMNWMGSSELIFGFIDGNESLYGKKVRGKSVYNHKILNDSENNVVFIASNAYKEIEKTIIENYKNIEVINVCEYAVKSRIRETFSQYKNKKFILQNDEKIDIAMKYFNRTGILIDDISGIDEYIEKKNDESIFVLIGKNHLENENKLIEAGMKYNKDYVVLTEIFYEDYQYVKENRFVCNHDQGSLGDKNLSDFFCPMPFTQLYYYDTRSGICSPTWNHETNVGSPMERSVDEIWNSPVSKLIRESILSGSFYFCNEELCWRILERKLFKKSEITDEKWLDIINNHKLEIEGGPEFLNIGYNCDCNLNCRMCRQEVIPKGTQQNVDLLQNRLKEYDFTNLKRLILPGNGELFLNPDYMYILKHLDEFKFPNLEAIWIYTNGILFTEEKFDEYILPLSQKYKVKIFVSTDAFYHVTYQKVRRGNYEVFTKNLKMLGRKRRENFFSTLLMPFCIQKENFREMSEFVQYAKEVGADCVHFEKLFYNPLQECVHRPEHVYYEEFVEELKRSIELGKKIGIEIDYKPFVTLVD